MDRLRAEFYPHRVGLLHGRMKSEEKENVMDCFHRGEIELLVTTVVVEVGVDVPNATVMWIERADRYGLAQLHQLRGRVGRGSHKSYCILRALLPLTEGAEARLSVMVETVVKLSVTTVFLLTLYPVTTLLLSVHVRVMEDDVLSAGSA